jgi:capsular polysaccharide transport system permease protein
MSKSEMTDDAKIAAWKDKRAALAATDAVARSQHDRAPSRQPDLLVKKAPQSRAMVFLKSVPSDTPTSQKASRPSRTLGLWTPFMAMVMVPCLLIAAYLVFVATPLYEARSVIAITKTGDTGGSVQAGLLGGLEKPANLQEVFRAHTYMKSQSFMDALEAEIGLVSDLSSNAIDPLRRLRTIPFLSISKHMQFDRFVESSVDVQSGLLTLYVRADSHDKAILVSDVVLRNAERQVTRLAQLLFEKRQSHAAELRVAAEIQVQNAQATLLAIQLKYQDVDPKNRVRNIYARIKELEDEAYRIDNEVQKALIAGVGDNRQTEKLIALAAHIETQISQQRSLLVSPDGTSATPLNNMLMEYERATLNVELAREAVKTALETQANASRAAAMNRSVFQVVVPPSTAQAALYPSGPATLSFTLLICLTFFGAVVTLRGGRS